MKKRFDTDFKRVLQDLTKEEEQKKRNGDACSLCGNEKINFEPTSYYCNGAGCAGQRIRRDLRLAYRTYCVGESLRAPR